MQGKLRQDDTEVSRESGESGKQHIGHARGLQVLPEPFDEIQFGTVVRKPEDLQMLFGILPADLAANLVLERAVNVELQVVVALVRRDLPVEFDGLRAIRIDDGL